MYTYVCIYIYVFMYVCYFCIRVHDQWMTENIGVGFNMYVMYLYIMYLYMYTIVCVNTYLCLPLFIHL